jgi:O-antigen ligase
VFFALSALYVALNGWLVYQNEPWGWALPLLLLGGYLAFFHLDILIWGIVLATPLSIGLEELNMGLGISLPSEPMLAAAVLIFGARQLYKGTLPRKFWYHPVTVVLLIQLLWMGLTTISSSMPDISAKFVAARLWFVGVMFFGTVMLYQKHLKGVLTFTLLHVVPLGFVIVYATIRLISLGMDKEMAHFSMQPFYKDHAVYGACIAMFIPLMTGFTFGKGTSSTFRFLSGSLLVVLIMGLIFSYTRAAWVSMVVAIGVYVILRFRIHLRWVVFGLLVGGGVFFSMYDSIVMDLERNKTDSSDDLAEHVESISNISTDASNLERINRWNSALRMFEERPVLGWGPGTYSFQYAPFQHSSDLTIISTNTGALGNAHSEYLGPLAESGVPGALLSVLLLVVVFWRCISLYKRMDSEHHKVLLAGAFMGLITYFTHGVLNNYLDQDKAAVPFYGLLAMVVAMDLFHKPAPDNKSMDKT